MAWLTVSYVLWLFGGWFGLHHLYLRRDKQAFVWLCTFGGCFGLGWLRDLWRIPEYVDDCKETESNRLEFHQRVMRNPKPPFSIVRYGGELIMGNLFGYLVLMTMPADFVKEGLGNILSVYLPPLAVALGVYLVGNIGREKVTFKSCVIGAFCGVPWLIKDSNNIAVVPLLSAFAARWKGVSWRIHREKQQRLTWRLFKFGVLAGLYYSLWISAIYFNGTITTKDEETVLIRDAVNNFFKSPAWAETKDSLWKLYEFYNIHGWHKLWEELVEIFDPVGEKNAYKVLGVTSEMSQEEITSKYRKLAKQWHPDKHKDPAKKAEAQEKFIEIQTSYDVLSKLKTRRARKNKKSAENPNQTEL
ncbi:dnaJ homolog subfamily C member 22 [Patella vulgata]|uniref:dnaJ homolog subfamily C member 22 n=1 Tax=Patella vulgata TaxID=6465 RepID=UPI00217F3D18|nr:dnaJ homolog subfamily C member 22 [Patella vulgata]